MNGVAFAVAVPLLASALLAVLPAGWGARVNLGASALTFALVARLPWVPWVPDGWWLADGLGLHLAVLTALVGVTTAWYSLGYAAAEHAAGRLDAPRSRLYHAAFQAVQGFLLLALLTDNPGATWMGMEAATIAAVLAVGLPGTREAGEASWRVLVLCGAGLALALFGTIVLYLAAQRVLGPGLAAMSWSSLAVVAPRCDGAVLTLAFAFLLVGYGTKAALVPLHTWMADAQAEGPTPSAILSGGIQTAALAVILRLRDVMDANEAAAAPGPPIMALGLASVLLGAFALWRQRDVRRFLAFSTLGQNGLAAFAFGLGGPAATFAGLLHLTAHTLAKAAVFQCVGRAAQLAGGQRFADLGGLLPGQRRLGLPLALGIVALAGLPPFGLFASEFLILAETTRRAPWLLVPLGAALVMGGWALIARLQALCLGDPAAGPTPGATDLLGVWVLLALALLLGVAVPAPLAAWMQGIAAGLS